jgi:hypothetical protein
MRGLRIDLRCPDNDMRCPQTRQRRNRKKRCYRTSGVAGSIPYAFECRSPERIGDALCDV